MSRVYDEIVDFMAKSTGPEDVASFRPSDAANERVWDLVRKEKEAELTPEEKRELETYLQLEHLMRLVKARARLHLANG